MRLLQKKLPKLGMPDDWKVILLPNLVVIENLILFSGFSAISFILVPYHVWFFFRLQRVKFASQHGFCVSPEVDLYELYVMLMAVALYFFIEFLFGSWNDHCFLISVSPFCFSLGD